MLSQTITKEATAICKGMEMTHGNSFHYLTFELDSGERVYFQVSIKCYMMIVEGDRCLITYKDSRSSAKKKLKSFEIIAKTVPTPVPTRIAEPTSAPTKIAEPIVASIPMQEKVTVFETNEEFNEIGEFDEIDEFDDINEFIEIEDVTEVNMGVINEIEPVEVPNQKKPNQGNQNRNNQKRNNQNQGNQNRSNQNQNRNNQNQSNQNRGKPNQKKRR